MTMSTLLSRFFFVLSGYGNLWPTIVNYVLFFKDAILAEAAASDRPATVGDAPPALRDEVEKFLRDLRAKASGFVMKGVYTLLLNLVPNLIDKLWDKLFEDAVVTVGSASFRTNAVSAPKMPSESEIMAACLAA